MEENSQKKNALITGIASFAGSHLAEYLLSTGFYEVYGLIRHRTKTDYIDHINHKLHLIQGDVLDAHSMDVLIEESKPDYIFHLAGQSFVPQSYVTPSSTFETNAIGTINLLEAIKKYAPEAKVQIACSSEEYGLVKENELPIKETNPIRPLSPYATSKAAQDNTGYQYFMSYGMNIVRTRAFNHTGPRRGNVFVSSTFAQQIARIEKGLQKPVIEIGNLEAKRDFTDVRDVVKAYELSILAGEPGEAYNICSGKTIKISDILERLLSMSNINQKSLELKKDPKRMRPSDVPVLQGDYRKFKKRTGWEPKIPFDQTLEDLLNFWRERV